MPQHRALELLRILEEQRGRVVRANRTRELPHQVPLGVPEVLVRASDTIEVVCEGEPERDGHGVLAVRATDLYGVGLAQREIVKRLGQLLERWQEHRPHDGAEPRRVRRINDVVRRRGHMHERPGFFAHALLDAVDERPDIVPDAALLGVHRLGRDET